MIIIGKYAELAPDMGFPSMKQYLQKEPYDTKAAVLKYLRNGHVHMVTASRIVDVFSGKKRMLSLFIWMTEHTYGAAASHIMWSVTICGFQKILKDIF